MSSTSLICRTFLISRKKIFERSSKQKNVTGAYLRDSTAKLQV